MLDGHGGVEVLLNGEWINTFELDGPRLYELVDTGHHQRHELTLVFEAPATAYAFSFAPGPAGVGRCVQSESKPCTSASQKVIERTARAPNPPQGPGAASRDLREDREVCLAIPGQIVEMVDEANRLARVDVVGVQRNVNIGLLDNESDGGARPGDWVLIHVGFALSKIDEEEAHATHELLKQMGADYEQELEELKASAIE